MKLTYKMEIQACGKSFDIANLETCVANYLAKNNYAKKDTTVYLNLAETTAYFVEKKKDEITKDDAVTFDTLLDKYAVVEDSKPTKAKTVKAQKVVAKPVENKEEVSSDKKKEANAVKLTSKVASKQTSKKTK